MSLNITYNRPAAPFLWAYLLLACILGACKKTPLSPNPGAPTLEQYVSQDTTLSLYQLALERSGLDTVLADQGPYTIFAPVNSAFEAAGLTADKISAYDPAQLYALLSYQVALGRIGSSSVQGFTTDSVVTLNGQYKPLVELNYYGLFINGIPVTQGNISLADGILHKIGQIAFAPTGNLLQVLDSLPNTTMAAYIFSQSAALRTLIATPLAVFQNTYPWVQQPGYYAMGDQSLDDNSITLLIPSDEAFQAYGFKSTADLAALDSVTRTNLVINGVLFGTYFTSDLIGGQYVGSLNNVRAYRVQPSKTAIYNLAEEGLNAYNPVDQSYDPYYLSTSAEPATFEFGTDGLTLLGNGVQTPPMIVQPNIISTVGVVHIINQVFAPVGAYKPGYTYQ